MSKFFIDRPIFAWVIALVIMLVGALSILKLPINQYPSIAPPAISISVTYPGASAQTVQDTVVQVIEQQLNGIDNLRYVSSDSNSDGSMTITVTFNQGTNPDIAQVQVQNKLNLATPLLPQEVQQQGIRVTKSVKNFLMVIGLVSEDGSMTKDDLFTMTENLVINLEEIDTMPPSELNQLKAMVTQRYVDERRAYGRNKVHLPHVASFVATGNNLQFLTDDTGNRRWLPFEVEDIDSPWEADIPYEGIYSQTYALVTRNFAASLFRNIKYFTLRKLYLCRKWMQKRLQKTTTTGITLPNFDFLA